MGSNSAGIIPPYMGAPARAPPVSTCSICGEALDGDIRLLNHMMERHGWRNPAAGKPDRNSRGY